MLSTPPRFSHWNWSAVGVAWGETPQKLAGTADAVEANNAEASTATAKTAVQARTNRCRCLRFGTAQLASGEAEDEPGLPGCLLERSITTAPEIAASTDTTIKIGTSGEDPPPSSVDEACCLAWVTACGDPAPLSLAEPPWLPCVLALALPEPPAPVDGVPPA